MPAGYYIPETMENWKWPRHINPHHNEVHPEATAWIKSFITLSPKTLGAFDRCNFNLFASLCYPLHDKVHLRSCCDFMNIVLVCDEFSHASLHEDEVQAITKAIMGVLLNPPTPRPKDEWVGVEITRQFWERTTKTASPQAQKRLIKAYEAHTKAVVQRTADKRQKYIRTVQEYFEIRRDTIGVKPSFALIELDMNLPDEAVQHPVVGELTLLAIDMIILDNDILSYNVEQARGDDAHNIVTIVMHEHNIDIQGAMNWVYEYHKELEAKFLNIYENKIPKFGEPVDAQLAQYVDGIGNWVRGNYQWSFETERYFGKKGPEIEETRWVVLLPKEFPSLITNCSNEMRGCKLEGVVVA